MKQVAHIILFLSASLISGCIVSSRPVPMGGDSYYTAAVMGWRNSEANTAHEMREGNKFCARMGRQFEVVSLEMHGNMGASGLTFKCVESSHDVALSRDNGVTTIVQK